MRVLNSGVELAETFIVVEDLQWWNHELLALKVELEMTEAVRKADAIKLLKLEWTKMEEDHDITEYTCELSEENSRQFGQSWITKRADLAHLSTLH